MAERTAVYSLKIDSNAQDVGAEGAASLEKLKTTIEGSQRAIKEMSSSFRALRGTSDEVKAAKAQLKTSIDAERNALSSTTLAIVKQGTSYEKLAGEAKASAAASITAAKNRAEEEKKASAARDAASEKSAKAELTSSLKVVGAMAAVAVAAKVAFDAIVSITRALLEWVIVTGIAERQANLQREAWTGTAESATNLGQQLDLLARKVVTPREELQKLGGELVRTLSGTTVTGQGIVDTFNAVGQAAAAMGDGAGKAIGEIVTRSKQFGRVHIDPFELQGTGLTRTNVAEALAKQMKISVGAAVTALAQGRVEVDDAAAALRAAVETRFAGINAKLTLGDVAGTLKKRFDELTKGIDWEPLLKGLEGISSLFDVNTVSGSSLQLLLKDIAEGIGKAFTLAVPVVRDAFIRLETIAFKIGTVFLNTRADLKEAFGGSAGKDLEAFRVNLLGLLPGAQGLGGAVDLIAKGFKGAAFEAMHLLNLLTKLIAIQNNLTGTAVGIGKDLRDAADSVAGAVGIDVHGPTEKRKTEFAPGHAEGGVVTKPAPGEFFASVAPGERIVPRGEAGPAGAPGASKAGPTIGKLEVHLHAATEAAAHSLTQPRIMQMLTQAIEDACRSIAIPTQQAP